MTIRVRDIKAKLMRNPKFRREYEALAPEFEWANEMIAARARARLTQAQVAKRMGTTQSVIARIEGGRHLPSMGTLRRYAEALGCRVAVKLVPLALKVGRKHRKAG
jgi:transcriptional regulator with XRE-family HTH domain